MNPQDVFETSGKPLGAVMALGIILSLTACTDGAELPTAFLDEELPAPDYIIGPGDNVQIFVWRNPELSRSVAVRPDGKISVPLIEDLPATGKTPTELARDIEKELSFYV